jgi:hypothetical protein
MSAVTLDRAQRAALRREVGMCVSGWGDFELAFNTGDRAYVHGNLKRLRRLASAMDAIGWSEQADTPDRLPMQPSRSLMAWARSEVRDMDVAFTEFVPQDTDLDAYGALCAIGGDA